MCADTKKERLISSMTGFGRGVESKGRERYVVEARSVNNRYSECRIYGLKDDYFLEFELTKLVKQMFHRGKFDLILRKESNASQDSKLVESRLRKHVQSLRKMQQALGFSSSISLELALTTLPRENESDQNTTQDHPLFMKVSKKALEALATSRQKEGKILSEDLKKRLKLIKQWLGKIEKAIPEVQVQRKKDVSKKIQAALQNLPMDSKRIESEIALMIEKMDVTEETVRFKKHLQSFDELLSGFKYSEQSVGRELDFTMQEMSREINTLGAKIGNVDLSKIVVNIKSEMEKIREQVQNIE